MRLGTTIAALVLLGSLTSSNAELGWTSGEPASGAPPSLGPPTVRYAHAAAQQTDRRDRAVSGRAVHGTTGAPSWSMNLAAGEGAGIQMTAGTVRLDPSEVFLAPLEPADERAATGTDSTGADPGAAARTEGTLDSAGGAPVPTGLLTLPIQRLTSPTVQVDSLVLAAVPAGSTASVDVRGRDADGNWSEWFPTGGALRSTVTLPQPAVAVQGRLVLTGPPTEVAGPNGPAVRGVTLTVHPLALPPTAPESTSPTSTTPTSTTTTTATPTTTTEAAVPGTTLTTAPVAPTTESTERAVPVAVTSTSNSRSTSTTTTTAPTTTTRAAASSGTTTGKPATTTTTSPSSKPATTTTTKPATTTTGKPTSTTTSKPTSTTATPAKSATGASSYRVFATREGLVGRTTANGHKIKSADRFVALPSRRALSARGKSDYSVRVCASNGRCATAPVWDVGPWNTRDDYWNPKSVRQEWRDLPQGTPEAQAAKERGYNGGKDQFGRKVTNPAGIDLSDGLFWSALGLKDNSWVTVQYLWTGKGSGSAAG